MTGDYCEACKSVSGRLIHAFESRRLEQAIEVENDDGRIASFGSVLDIFSRDACPSCKQLQREIQRWEKDYDWPLAERLIIDVVVPDYSRWTQSLEQPMYISTFGPEGEELEDEEQKIVMNLYFSEPTGRYDKWGRAFDTHEINIDLVNAWLKCCVETHTEYCSSRMVENMDPTMLLESILLYDVEDRCLKYCPLSDTKYMALSYVWGQVNTFRTTLQDLGSLTKPGSIHWDNEELAIPQTIRDVMRLAHRLDIRYVWVDSLCIVQDGPDKPDHLNGMAGIYASAYLTVVAEGPDANFGLPGIGNGAKPRNRPCRPLNLPEIACLMDDNRIPPKKPRIWEHRAWTFQEGLFAGRVVCFDTEGFVGWKCSTQFWNEKCVSPSESLEWARDHPTEKVNDWRYYGLGELNFRWPDMRRWCTIAEEYYQRELTFDDDAHNALSGTISVISQTCPGNFVWGLPDYFFDIYLLWDMGWSSISGLPMRRDSKEVPSWSFLGWKGGFLDTFWWRFSMDYTFIDDPDQGFGGDIVVSPVVEWYLKDEKFPEPRRIQNSYHLGRTQPAEDPPVGWNKKPYTEGEGYYFIHDSLGDDVPFVYPITLPSGTRRCSRRENPHQLHFRTKRAFLRVGPDVEIPRPLRYREARHVSLLDEGGKWVGAMSYPSLELSTEDGVDGSSSQGARLELIAIAGGKVRNDCFPTESMFGYWNSIPEWEHEDRPKDGEFYEFYFVLWVEWDGGIAYRRSLGRVDQSAWLQVQGEEIDVVLG